jgi:hypothetical protein
MPGTNTFAWSVSEERKMFYNIDPKIQRYKTFFLATVSPCHLQPRLTFVRMLGAYTSEAPFISHLLALPLNIN